jgi:hypothetical protein
VYKVADKVFLIVTDDPDEQIITVKCEPEHARALERGYASITPGRYVDKSHWISLGPGWGITKQLNQRCGRALLRPGRRRSATERAPAARPWPGRDRQMNVGRAPLGHRLASGQPGSSGSCSTAPPSLRRACGRTAPYGAASDKAVTDSE